LTQVALELKEGIGLNNWSEHQKGHRERALIDAVTDDLSPVKFFGEMKALFGTRRMVELIGYAVLGVLLELMMWWRCGTGTKMRGCRKLLCIVR